MRRLHAFRVKFTRRSATKKIAAAHFFVATGSFGRLDEGQMRD
jgi:hypothetical protein